MNGEECTESDMKIPFEEKPVRSRRSRSSTVSVKLEIYPKTKSEENLYQQRQPSSYTAGGEIKNVENHMRIGSGEKTYKCEHCPYAASIASTLKTHLRTHSGDKPYKCQQCHYAACRPAHLEVHMKVHSGDKPYKCPQCPYAASLTRHLKNHIKTHLGETI